MTATSEAGLRRGEVLDRFWRLASSGYVTLALFALLAVTLALTIVFPQLPASLGVGERARQLDALTSSYRNLGPLLRWLGAFTIFDGLWLRLLAGLLAYNLLLRLADRARLLREAGRPVSAAPAPRPGHVARRTVVTATPAGALAAVQEAMRPHYPTLVVETTERGARVYGRRGEPGAAAGLLFTLGLLCLLAGLMVNAAAGWYTSEMSLMASETARFPVAGGLEIAFNGFGEGASSSRASVTVTWADGRRVELRPGRYRPDRTGHLWVVQLGEGPVLRARAGRAGRPLLLQVLATDGRAAEELRMAFRQAQTEQAFAVPDAGLTLRTVSYDALPGQGIAGPVFLVEAYRGDDPTPLLTKLVEVEATLSVDDVIVELRRERYVVLVAAYLPGLVLLAAAGVLMAAAALLAAGWGYVETWAALSFGRPTVAIAFRTSAPWRPAAEAGRLLAAVEAALAAPTSEGGRGPAEHAALARPGETGGRA